MINDLHDLSIQGKCLRFLNVPCLVGEVCLRLGNYLNASVSNKVDFIHFPI